jgi:hypothetical protein
MLKSNYLFHVTVFVFQFSDKLEVMIDTMQTTAEQVEKAEPVSAHPDKLRDQITDNRVC